MKKKEKVSRVLEILEGTYKDTTTALNYQTPFQLLVSTMLAAQSTDVRVNIVTKDFFAKYPDAKSMSQLSVDEIIGWIKTVGLYKTKAKNLAATCKILAENFGDDIPSTREELVKLPGVGRKTANVVLSIAKNIPAIAVDTHVFRLSNRIGLAKANDVLNTEKQLMKNIPKEKWSEAHHWLIWHGRKICKARKPLCEECPINQYCKYSLAK
ncbi:MAG: endonuclease III [Calditrichaeota bacterium]|nr:MAG: endonuclease III [Calditrichota bacterium]MBL1205562.1 endonuclease III [Calditrichota bacterium]NOG45391.1 endonuclease III [Calditrichota bacterium]